MLVSLGAALVTLIPRQPGETDAGNAQFRGWRQGWAFREPMRSSRSGEGDQAARPCVNKLTSAAATWVTVATGMVAGCGLWKLTVYETALALVILSGVNRSISSRPIHNAVAVAPTPVSRTA